MATPNLFGETSDWRKSILSQLQNRNRQECQPFNDLIALHNRLFESAAALRTENRELFVENETLRRQSLERLPRNSLSDGKPNDRVQALEQKLLMQQEELTELHRRKGENAQQIIDLNKKLQEKEKQLNALEISLKDSLTVSSTLRLDIQLYQNKIKELENLLQLLRDEHQALQLTCASLEEKLRKTQEENNTLVERLIRYKSKDAEKMNEENENFVSARAISPTAFLIQSLKFFGKRQAKLQKELEEAAKDTRPTSPDKLGEGAATVLENTLPTKLSTKIDAHEGEVHAVKWSPVDRIVATGGADRKVKLWDVSKVGQYESKGTLVGSSGAIMSVDFDCTGCFVLGASSDFASRVWTVSDLRLRVSGKNSSY
ncbi:autophagy-related protein 16-1-like isoform X1 [Schistocerca serialis cubense]|uniref:autophagy-related protein 16-1-like isoform X1 n=1 Tax=Schistocerca serialis cubense TaxID=2023355 RepID=UPI00214E4A3B|nr:autophagy-related protein 16-1-like isoform X1 [Schistocerca serialis cubense]